VREKGTKKRALRNPFYNFKCVFLYSENYIEIYNYITLLMNPEEPIQDNNDPYIEICEECAGEINCNKDNIYILTKEEESDKLWCQCCFEELWKEYSNNGWTGDDIEYYLELENEENEEKETS